MKRNFSEVELDSVTMANCLMLLAKGREVSLPNSFHALINTSTDRVFECKTCNRQFPSFQALGGHRASHKKPRLMSEGDGGGIENQSSPTKPKTHECSICGQEFSIGQALGGHMRRHRAALSDDDHHHHQRLLQAPPPVVKKSNSGRVLCLDLNLTPLENDLEFLKLGINMAAPPPMVDCFL